MSIDFARGTVLFKAMADETRIKIVHILSCGELCACDILDYFDITQPTLSHHLTILVDSGLVMARPDGKWTYYSLAKETFALFGQYIVDISHDSEKCLCKKTGRNCK